MQALEISKFWSNQKLRFLVIGGVNTIWGIISFPVLYALIKPQADLYLWLLVFTYVLNTTLSFLTQKYIVFKSQGNHLRQYLKFCIFQGVVFTVNIILLPMVVELTGSGPVVPQIIFTIFIALGSYVFHRYVTFVNKSKKSL